MLSPWPIRMFFSLILLGFLLTMGCLGERDLALREVLDFVYLFPRAAVSEPAAAVADEQPAVWINDNRVQDRSHVSGLFARRTATVEFLVNLARRPMLSVDIGLKGRRGEGVADAPRVGFRIRIRDGELEETLLDETLGTWEDLNAIRRIQVNLSAHTDRPVKLLFETVFHPGAERRVHAVWSRPRIVQVSRQSSGEAGAENPPNVILITVDTLRADHLGCYGNADVRTPNMDRLAREGVVFQQVVSQFNNTVPSHASLFTSQYGVTHGSMHNADPLGEEAVTLAEVLKEEGYRTAAMVGAWHLAPEHSGLGQGFEDVRYPHLERMGLDSTLMALSWISEHRSEPFFLWIHYYDPHLPYAPVAPFDQMYGSVHRWRASDRPPIERQILNRFGVVLANQPREWFQGITDLEYPSAMYRGEVSATDYALGVLWHQLRQMALAERTIVALTADHGEGLGEHNIFFGHHGLYAQQIRIPLIIRTPGERQAPATVSRLTESIDVAPTLLGVLGIAVPPTMKGTDLFEAGEPRPAFCQHGHDQGFSIQQGNWKFTRIHKAMPGLEQGIRLVDLAADPGESENLVDTHPEVVAELDSLAWAIAAGKSAVVEEEPDLDPETVEKLKAMGYLY